MTARDLVEVLLYAVLLPPLILAIFDSLCRLVFLVIAQMPRRAPALGEAPNDLRLLVLVVARDEEKAIEETLHLLKRSSDTPSSVAVLADHCSDNTVAIAAQMGALVFARSEGYPGKAEALSWFASGARDLLSAADVVAVLDADSLVQEGFCEAIRSAFRPGVEAVQGFVNPVSSNGFPLTTLVSFSEILSQKVDDGARSRLGWSVPLRGTGMAFRTSTFIIACEQLGTQVDDIELSVRLAERRIGVEFEARAVVDDPKSDQVLGLARQRGRWLKGQRQVWRAKGGTILKLLRSGLPNWSLIQAMLLKPKTALAALRVAMAALLWAWPFQHSVLRDGLLWGMLASITADAAYYVSGLRLTGNASKYLAALLASPMLLILWAVSWGYSILPTREWLSAEEK